jgi:IclR family transcriptional regulator, acetate operon repressor
MAAGMIPRGLSVIEALVGRMGGTSLSELAATVDLPKSAVHRILAELMTAGYVRQTGPQGEYMLTLRFVSLGIRHLAANGMVQLSKPILSRLAADAAALVRLSLVDDGRLVWVSQFQGAATGLRYDPDAGETARLSCSATGHAWLSQLSDDEALELIFRQGIGGREDYGPAAPQTVDEIRAELAVVRERGYASVDEMYEVGTSALAAPVFDRSGGAVVGVVSIAGPSAILTASRREELAEPLLKVTAELTGLGLSMENHASR